MAKRTTSTEIVSRAVRSSLDIVEAGTLIDPLTEGEAYICKYCQFEEKPCEDDPSFECRDMIMGETELQALLKRGNEFSTSSLVRCVKCGGPLKARDLKKSALRDLCPSCRAKSTRTDLKKHYTKNTP